MIDTMTNKPLVVRPAGEEGSYLILPNSQLDEVRRRFDARGISYNVSPVLMSMDGGLYTALVLFKKKVDIKTIQDILDR